MQCAPADPMTVVVFSPDVVGERMAGPGIRAFFFARELAKRFPVTLIAQLESGIMTAESFRMIDRRDPAARAELRRAAVVIGQPSRELLALDARRQALIFDLFDPVVLELQELYGPRPTLRERIHLRREWGRLHAALRRGWFLIAAAPRQRDFYAGVSATVDGVNRGWAERWIEVPFGIEDEDPGAPAVKSEPPLIVWGGGTWPWLDAETAVSAIRELNRGGVACRLLFLGGSRPNRNLPRMDLPQELRSDEVLINDDWVPFRQRARWLQPAKIAIMLHHRSLEAEFSIRTRLFDAIWCSLPVVATAGGFAADLVEGEGLGVVVKPSDVSEVANAIMKLLQDDALYAQSVSNLTRVRERYRWSEVTRPLIRAVEQWVK